MGVFTWIIPKIKASLGSPFKFTRRRRPGAVPISQPLPSSENPGITSIKETPTPSSSAHSIPSPNISSASRQTPSESPITSTTAESADKEKEIHHGSGQFTTGPCCTVLHNDGTANCYALLLTHRLFDYQRETIERTREKTRLTRKLADIDMKILVNEDNQRNVQASIKETESGQQASQSEESSKPVERDLLKDQREELQFELKILEISLDTIRGHSMQIIEQALRGADLLDIPETDADSTMSALEIKAPDHASVVTCRSNSTTISIEELLRRSVLEEIQQKKRTLYETLVKFNERYVVIEKRQAEYHQAVRDGTCSLPQSRFDCWGLEMMQNRTRAYIEAEEAFDEVETRARVLGVLCNEYGQESHFVDHADDGYHESFEAAMTGDCDRDWIEAWSSTVLEAQVEDVESPRSEEVDEWDAKSIGMGDSISVVDHSRNRSRIDRWRRMCGKD